MVSLFGTASETCLEIADRAPCAYWVRCRCARGCHTCEALGASTARMVLWGSRHAGSKGNPQKSGMRRMTPSVGRLPPALRIAHRLRVAERQLKHAGPRALGGFELARLYSLRAVVSKRLTRGAATPRFLLPLRAGGPKGDGAGCHIGCPIPIGTSLPRWEDLLCPHPLQAIEKFAERGGMRASIMLQWLPGADVEMKRLPWNMGVCEVGIGSLHQLCRCHKSTSRLT